MSILNLLGWFRKKQPTETKLIYPRVSFTVFCQKTGTKAYSGLDLNKPNGTSTGTVKCPCCLSPYKIRVKEHDQVGKIYKAGRQHTFTIRTIERKSKIG